MLANDWQLSGIFTAGSPAPYDMSYAYQTGGDNVNLTGSPSYGARVKIVGDPGSGCASNQYSQFNSAAFAGPNYGSVGLESGRFYMNGCTDHTVNMAIARNFRLTGGRNVQLRAHVFNVFNTVVYNARVTQLQLTNPTDQPFILASELQIRLVADHITPATLSSAIADHSAGSRIHAGTFAASGTCTRARTAAFPHANRLWQSCTQKPDPSRQSAVS